MWCLAPNCYGKFIPTTKLSESVGVDRLNDGVLGAGVWVAVAEFFADMERGFLAHTGQWWNGVERLLLTRNWHCCAQGSLETFSNTVFHAYSGRGYAFHFSLNKSKCCCIAGHFPHSEECRWCGGNIRFATSTQKKIKNRLFRSSRWHPANLHPLAWLLVFKPVTSLWSKFLVFQHSSKHTLVFGTKASRCHSQTRGESRCHNLSRKGQKSKPLYQGSFHQGFAHHFVLTRRVWSSFLLPWKPFLECDIHMLRGPLFYWCHNGKTKFPLELLEMLFYASDDWNQVVRV